MKKKTLKKWTAIKAVHLQVGDRLVTSFDRRTDLANGDKIVIAVNTRVRGCGNVHVWLEGESSPFEGNGGHALCYNSLSHVEIVS